MKKPKVFVVSRGYHDYSAAEPFGEIIYLAEGTMNKFNVANMVRQFETELKNSKPDDYLLIGGPTVMCIIAASMMIQLHGRVNMLLFRSRPKGDDYVERTLLFSDNLEKEVFDHDAIEK
jgi:hypothetical protein